ncbi:putative Coiled-coil and C2 domain-containing protein 1 [Daphnia magna]|uniref:Putative Coiled-coil and C2 domain-containing protein 1 n=1 Tax=Daphnia magna TaxID=35525 RepID=A0A164GYU7_9CRUS|nr:putative Coiled-coil and C2 domain-containing protein 1 [Daphnia magna]
MDDFVVLSSEDCIPMPTGDQNSSGIFGQLYNDLLAQLKLSSERCCTDLRDDDMEVTIIRGLSYNVANPKTIDTYARFEVPIPSSDNPTREKTNIVKDTNSPEYNETFTVTINRQSRTLLRVFKAKLIKFEVWAKG